MKVEELSSYGTAFDHMPRKAQILQLKVMFSQIRKKFGWLGIIRFIVKFQKKQKQLKMDYGDIINKRFADVPASAIMELYMMTAMYLVIADTEDKDTAYEFIKGIFQKIGPTAHETLYNIQDLEKCEGDIFANF